MLLLDNSAWARLADPRVPADRLDWVAGQMEAGELAVCLPFLLEAGYSARSAADHRDITARLGRLPHVGVSPEVEDLAVDAQARLAQAGHHRLPPSDLVIAACAHVAQAGVLHYDADFDRISTMTELDFRSEWLVPAGVI
jgi:predicted nucleic acid-binding protein